MRTSETIDKSIPLKPSEDYNFLRREGIRHIEKLGGDLWTDFNTHDPGITLLENLCYAITDLAYRTGFDMKDLLAKTNPGSEQWKNIFFTAREILPCNPVTINDYRKLIMDIKGVRNAWITISKDVEVPIFINQSAIKDVLNDPNLPKDSDGKIIGSCECNDKIRFPYKKSDETVVKGLVYAEAIRQGEEEKYKIIELNGLYKIILEYEEDVIEKNDQPEVRAQVLNVLQRHRNICEDYISITAAEYKDFFLRSDILLSEEADADLVLAEMSYIIQSYFTPAINFYSLDEMLLKGFPVDEIFEGPALKHGFILDADLEKTDMFRDMRLSDIIDKISDIKGIKALKAFKILDAPGETPPEAAERDACSNVEFFAEWIDRIKKQKLVGRLSIDDLLKFFHPSEDDLVDPVSDIRFSKPSGNVTINTNRFEKFLNDFKGRDKYLKKDGFTNNFPVPTGENMELEKFYPVQYQLPFTYRMGKDQLPLRDGKQRLVQALQLKGYLAIFEQLFLNHLYQIDNLNDIFSFRDIKFQGKSKHRIIQSACDPKTEKSESDEDKEDKEKQYPKKLHHLVFYKGNELKENIEGYKCLYYDADKYLGSLQSIIQPESDFEWQRNQMLDHLLSRFNEQIDEYVELMKYLYPDNYLPRVIKNKTDLLADYTAISNGRFKAYNYRLHEEETNYENKDWDEKLIAFNISGLEKRIARLLGLKSYERRDLAPYKLFIINERDKDNKPVKKIVLYENVEKEIILLETKPVEGKCADELMHLFIESGCCTNNFRKYPEDQLPHKRVHQHYQQKVYSFALKDKTGREIATSPVYNSSDQRDVAMDRAKCLLEKVCQSEGLHMIEHILLRPKGDTQLSDEQGSYGEEFKLLDICVDKCDLTIKQKGPVGTQDYKFDLQVLPPEECLDGKRWKVILNRVRSKKTAATLPLKIFEFTFKEYELASDFIARVREYGSEMVNFEIFRSQIKKVSTYYFKLKDKIGNTIVESSCYSVFAKNLVVDEKTRPGKRTKCNEVNSNHDTTIDDRTITEEIEKLKDFFAYENDLYCCEESCDHNEDPYSFRVTFVLPCWPERFRNKGFRKFVEKVIRAETPAHIHPVIFWLGIEEMREFEESYFNWVIEMAAQDVPPIEACNRLINQIIHLKNCDEECEDKDSMYITKADRTGVK